MRHSVSFLMLILLLVTAVGIASNAGDAKSALMQCFVDGYRARVAEIIAENVGGESQISVVLYPSFHAPEEGLDLLNTLEGPELVLTQFNASFVDKHKRLYGSTADAANYSKTGVSTVVRRRLISVLLATRLRELWQLAVQDQSNDPLLEVCIDMCTNYQFSTASGECAAIYGGSPGSESERLAEIVHDLRLLARAKDDSDARKLEVSLLETSQSLIENLGH